jgi:hypothetical protein
MTIPPDLDKGGTNVQKGRIYQGPSLGWVDAIVQDTTPAKQDTILFRTNWDIWEPITLGGNLTFSNGVLNAVGAGLPDAPADGQTYGRLNNTWTVVTGGGTGGGNVSSSGSPVNGQVAQWVSGTAIQGVPISSFGLAPLNGPVFTGDPQAPTPLAADNDNSIATTAYVTSAVSTLSGTITASLNTKAPLASPVFTGDPQAPTPATTDNDTSIATTAFVKNVVGGYQPLDDDLTAISALTGVNVIYFRSGPGAWTPVTIGANMSFASGVLSSTGGGGGGGVATSGTVTASMLTGYADSSGALIRGINLPPAGLALSTNNLVLANDLAALEGISATGVMIYRSGVDTWSTVTIGAGLSFSGGTLTSTGAAGVTSLNGLSGVVNLVAGSNITITPAGQNLTIASTAGGGNVSNSATPAAGQVAVWTDATHIQGRNIFTCSVTAPASPQVGDFWYSLTSGLLSAYINDGNSLQWIQISPAIPGPSDFVPRSQTTNIVAGYTFTPNNLGNIPNFTINPALGNYQYGSNTAARTWTAPTADCAVDILVTNSATAGAITFSGFTVGASIGDPLTTNSGDKFVISIRRIHGISSYYVRALQ